MVYVAPPDSEILYTAQVEIHSKRGGPFVVFPSPDDKEVQDRVTELKQERADKIQYCIDNNEGFTNLNVPPAEENPETVSTVNGEQPNKAASTPGAAPLVSDNVGQIKEKTPAEIAAEALKKVNTH